MKTIRPRRFGSGEALERRAPEPETVVAGGDPGRVGGYGYCRFHELLRGVLNPGDATSRVAGEKAFVGYSGKRIGIVDPTTGEIHEAEIFVGVLGASN